MTRACPTPQATAAAWAGSRAATGVRRAASVATLEGLVFNGRETDVRRALRCRACQLVRLERPRAAWAAGCLQRSAGRAAGDGCDAPVARRRLARRGCGARPELRGPRLRAQSKILRKRRQARGCEGGAASQDLSWRLSWPLDERLRPATSLFTPPWPHRDRAHKVRYILKDGVLAAACAPRPRILVTRCSRGGAAQALAHLCSDLLGPGGRSHPHSLLLLAAAAAVRAEAGEEAGGGEDEEGWEGRAIGETVARLEFHQVPPPAPASPSPTRCHRAAAPSPVRVVPAALPRRTKPAIDSDEPEAMILLTNKEPIAAQSPHETCAAPGVDCTNLRRVTYRR